jgi:hypothetical protein
VANTAVDPAVCSCPQEVSIMAAFPILARRIMKPALVTILVTITCLAATCLAQNQSEQNQSEPPSAPEPQASAPAPPARPDTVTVPGGTRFALVLTNPISSRLVHHGDQIHAQTTAPIAVGDQVVIPAGTFVQGVVDKLARNGNRAEIALQSAKVILADGYVVEVPGPLSIETDEGTAWLNPSTGTKTGMILAPLAGAGIGAAIGSAAHTTNSSTLGGTTITTSSPRGLAIGSMAGLGAGSVVALVLFARSHQFYVETGSSMQMTVPQPITLTQERVYDANVEAQAHPAPTPTPAPHVSPVTYPSTNHGTCFTPGTPGTPPTVIPGAPGPNGIPGPPTIIPGTPPTPGTPYPCP